MNAAYFGHKQVYPSLIDDLLATTPEIISVDIETVSLEDRTIVGIGIGLSPTEAIYFPLGSKYMSEVLAWLNDNKIIKIMHNALFDTQELDNAGLMLIDTPVIDTLVMAQLAGYSLRLTELSAECGTESQDMKTILGEQGTKVTTDLSFDVLARKCCIDAEATIHCYHHLRQLVDMDYVRDEMELIPIIVRMQRIGLKVDHMAVQRVYEDLGKEVSGYKEQCRIIGFNPGSSKQVGYILAKHGITQVINSRKAKYQTDKKILSKINHPLAKMVLAYRAVSKLQSTYIKPLLGVDRAYTHFSFETTTRRLASAKINLQNIPKKLRYMFVPDRDCWTRFDFSQQELRVLAYVSGDRRMQEVFDSGSDIHLATASFMYGVPMDQVTEELRYRGKTANFSTIYGSSDPTLAALRKRWYETFPQAASWIHDIQQFALAHMKVPTVDGAWLYIRPEITSMEKLDDMGIMRKAVDYVCQGTGAEITKKGMRRCKKLPMILQIHDELMIADDWVNEIEKLDLAHVGPFETPIDIKLVRRWGVD